MISSRTLRSLMQYIELHKAELIDLLFEKHGVGSIRADDGVAYPLTLSEIRERLIRADQICVLSLLGEVVSTSGDLRNRISPRYRHDERFDDLTRCLQLDGYEVTERKLAPRDPSVAEGPPIEDDLSAQLSACGLPNAQDIIRKIADSADAFRATPPNYNASLNDARVALQTLAKEIATVRLAAHPGQFDDTKWGAILSYLRTTGFVEPEEERGLAGVFGFVSPGSHRPVGLSEAEFARLGRGFVAGMCWFLVKRFLSGQ